jgi:CMP-2-keto-3-deoxyoctulosonic acid synthetase
VSHQEWLNHDLIYPYFPQQPKVSPDRQQKSLLECSEGREILRVVKMGQTVRMLKTRGTRVATDEPQDVEPAEQAERIMRGLGLTPLL